MDEVTIYNIYEHVNYEFINNILKIRWNPKNLAVNEIMILERSVFLVTYTHQQTVSCCWVNELKRVTGWKNGDTIYFQSVVYKEGLIEIVIRLMVGMGIGMEMIDENGYLLTKHFKCSGDGYYDEAKKKCECIYNDLVDEELTPYILK